MGFVDATKNYFIRWVDFQGRSSRSEYWWALLSVLLISIAIIPFFGGVFGGIVGLSDLEIDNVISIVMLPWQIFSFVASLSLVIRRLHDTERSGWWYLIVFTIIGMIPLLIWICTKGTDGDNIFGSDPLSS